MALQIKLTYYMLQVLSCYKLTQQPQTFELFFSFFLDQYNGIEFFGIFVTQFCVKLQVLIRGEAPDTKDVAAVCCTTWCGDTEAYWVVHRSE